MYKSASHRHKKERVSFDYIRQSAYDSEFVYASYEQRYAAVVLHYGEYERSVQAENTLREGVRNSVKTSSSQS